MKTRFLNLPSCQNQSGQTAVEYMLVLAVLVLGLAASLMSPTLRNAITTFYDGAGERIVRPGKP